MTYEGPNIIGNEETEDNFQFVQHTEPRALPQRT